MARVDLLAASARTWRVGIPRTVDRVVDILLLSAPCEELVHPLAVMLECPPTALLCMVLMSFVYGAVLAPSIHDRGGG